MGATSGAGTACPSGAPEFTPVFSGVRVARSLVLCVYFVVVCPFFFFLLAIVLSVVLRYTDSDYPFAIFKLFLINIKSIREFQITDRPLFHIKYTLYVHIVLNVSHFGDMYVLASLERFT